MITLTPPPKDCKLSYIRINHKFKFQKMEKNAENNLELLLEKKECDDNYFKEIMFTNTSNNPNQIQVLIGNLNYDLVRIAPFLCDSFYKKYSILKYKQNLFNLNNLLDVNIIIENKDYFLTFTTKAGPFSMPTTYQEKFVQLTQQFEWVRSKSERTIADSLFVSNIAFEYETLLIGITGRLVRPDFTIEMAGKSYYWEHVGMMDNENYRNKWEEKKKIYEKFKISKEFGIYGKLIVTKETSLNDFSPIDAKYYIDNYFSYSGSEKWLYNENIYIKKLENSYFYYSPQFKAYREVVIKKIRDEKALCIEVDNQKIYLLIRSDYTMESLIAYSLVVLEKLYNSASSLNLSMDVIKFRGIYLDNKIGNLNISIQYMYKEYSKKMVEATSELQLALIASLEEDDYYLVTSMHLEVLYKEILIEELNSDYYYSEPGWLVSAKDKVK